MRDFDGKTVVVTGSTAGVGRAVARAFAQAGAKVGLIARDREALEDTRAEIESVGGYASCVAADVADPDAVLSAANTFERQLGPIDVWVNNAMVTVYSPLVEMTPEEFRRVTEVDYLGFVYGTMAALRHMRPRDHGVIVQIGSSLAYRGIPLQSAYCGAKHAIRGFTDSLRSELLHDRSSIAITMVQLPAVNTPQFDWARLHIDRQPRPVPPVVQPEAVARAVLRAAREPHREYWLGSSTVKTILGSMVAPRFLDRYLARFAYRAEKTHRPALSDRRDNLVHPVHDLHRTRGSFGRGARSTVTPFTGDQVRGALAGAAALIGLAWSLALLRVGRTRRLRSSSDGLWRLAQSRSGHRRISVSRRG